MLEDVVAIELGTSTSSAYCGRLLLDAGATVLRRVDPELTQHERPYDRYLHHGKHCVTGELDAQLATRIDIVVYDDANSAHQSGLAELRLHNESLVVVALSDYGLDGPDSSTPASELTLQAESGLAALHPTGERPPVRCGVDLGALTSGVCAAAGAIMGLLSRESGGSHVDVDVSRFEALTSILQYPWLFGQFPEHYPYPLPQNAIPGIERASDGWVCVVAITPQQWADFKRLAAEQALDDPRFDSPSERIRLGPEITKYVRRFTEAHTVEELVNLGVQNRVPIVPVGTPDSVAGLPPYASRDSYVRTDGGFIEPRAPFRLHGLDQPPVQDFDGSVVPDLPPRLRRRRSDGGNPRQPLQGLRVIEFGTFQAGPLAGAHLASLGAEVIKVESAKRPDLIRFTGTPFSVERFWERSASFAGVNLGKRAITIDLTVDEGLEILRKLIATSDLLIENYSPRVLDQRGFDYESVRQIRSDIIMVRMPAWGLDGPWKDWPGFTYTANAASGLSEMTGYPDGEPLLTGTVIDPIAGFLTAFVALCAIRDRQTTGTGGLVEVPLCDVAAQLTAKEVVEASSESRDLTRRGNRNPDSAPSGIYRCADQTWLAISVDSDRQWAALGRLDVINSAVQDSRFANTAGRLEHHDELDQMLTDFCAIHESGELVRILRTSGVPAAPVRTGADAIEHPQLVARNRIHIVDHPVVGAASYVGLPMTFSPTPEIPVPQPAPLLGQDNVVLLTELGYRESEIENLIASKVIGSVPG